MASNKHGYYEGVDDLEEGCGVAEPGTRRSSQRYHLTQAQLRKLTPFQRPEIDPQTGRVQLVPNRDGKPQRYLLTMGGGSLPGFGVYVGKTKTSYEVQVGTGSKVKRLTLGDVHSLTLEEAFRKAVDARELIRKTGDTPKRNEKRHEDALVARQKTVEQCMDGYISYLEKRMKNGLVKPASVEAAKDSLTRLSRKEVGLSKVEIRDLLVADADSVSKDNLPLIVRAWHDCRRACMELSNRLTEQEKDVLRNAAAWYNALETNKKLEGVPTIKDWWELKPSHLQELGFKGRHIQRALSAGLAATEHTFGDLHRAIKRFIEEEKRLADIQDRQAEVRADPTWILKELGYFRDQTQLRAHHRKAQTRNPLGEAAEDPSLQRAMKALIQRRDLFSDPIQKVGVDYLFIVLLWGLRRNEGAVLRWYVDCTDDELLNESRSWVWLASHSEEKNPTTGKRGSQAFLHDTKTGEVRLIPICYFAERILRQRWEDRLATVEGHEERLRKAKNALVDAQQRTTDERKLAAYRVAINREDARRVNSAWVFPARSTKAKDGHYKDSKALLKNLRVETGRLDLSRDIDQGLTVHDFRRTLGRFASKQLSSRMVSELLRHFQRDKDSGAKTTEQFYTDQEWVDVRSALGQIEEAMIRTSPRVWNRLKGPDKPVLDEVNDPPVKLAWSRRGQGDEEE